MRHMDTNTEIRKTTETILSLERSALGYWNKGDIEGQPCATPTM